MQCRLATILASCFLIAACQPEVEQTNTTDLTEFAERYAAAWSGQNPEAFALFYSENGSLRINDGEPSVGRDAVTEIARDFMTGFPDMVVRLVELRHTDDFVEFHWHWTGTNTGPGGTGNAVNLMGYEQWTLDEDGLIQESLGHLDDAEYQRQLHADSVHPEIVEIFACSDLCPEPIETYIRRVYKGVTDPEQCLKLGGAPFSVTGWGTQHYCAAIGTEFREFLDSVPQVE
jgi:nuclear transport factor 2 (NTF2) superfamily protein